MEYTCPDCGLKSNWWKGQCQFVRPFDSSGEICGHTWDIEKVRPCLDCGHLKFEHQEKDKPTCKVAECKCWFYSKALTPDENLERNKRLLDGSNLVIFGIDYEEGKYMSPVENSFSLGISASHAHLYWGYGTETKEQAATREVERLKEDHPTIEFKVYDSKDVKGLPVTLDWDKWIWAYQPSGKTLSGIVDKYIGRNIPFKVKPEAQKAIVKPEVITSLSRDW